MGSIQADKAEAYFKRLIATYVPLTTLSQHTVDLLHFAVTMAYLEGHIDATAEAVKKINDAHTAKLEIVVGRAMDNKE